MKKIINRKIYDTETAEEIARWHNLLSTRDFNYCSETLYKTKNGAYFLYGSGGALSKYARSCGTNSWCGSENITLLTKEEAYEWCEEKNMINAIEIEFKDLIEEA